MAFRKKGGLLLAPLFGTIDRFDPINNELIGLWHGTNPGKFMDISSGYNPIDLTQYSSTTSIGVSPWGRAAKWDGSSQFGQSEKNVQVVDGVQRQGFTAVCWVKPASFSNYQSPFNQWDEGSSARLWGLTIFSSGIVDGCTSSTGSDFANTETTATLTSGVWQMIAMTYQNNTNTVNVYINRNLCATGTGAGSGIRQNAQPLYLGKSPNFGGSGNAWFNGQTALHRLIGRALTGTEIGRLYSYPLAGIIAPHRSFRQGPPFIPGSNTSNMFFG